MMKVVNQKKQKKVVQIGVVKYTCDKFFFFALCVVLIIRCSI